MKSGNFARSKSTSKNFLIYDPFPIWYSVYDYKLYWDFLGLELDSLLLISCYFTSLHEIAFLIISIITRLNRISLLNDSAHFYFFVFKNKLYNQIFYSIGILLRYRVTKNISIVIKRNVKIVRSHRHVQ